MYMQVLSAQAQDFASGFNHNTMDHKKQLFCCCCCFLLLQHTACPAQTAESGYTYISIGKSSVKSEPETNTLFPVDVDSPLPLKTRAKANRFALIIGNENYAAYGHGLSNTEYAVRDAESFRMYAVSLLGIPEENIFFRTDVSAGTMEGLLKRFVQAASMAAGKPELFIYYSGHGMPGAQDGESFLLPVDADLISLESSLSLRRLMTDIASTPASRIVLFLDACFSGAGRSGNVLLSSRGVGYLPSPAAVPERTVVFSAGTARQPALCYREAEHGLFTYCLLKSLRYNGRGLQLGALVDEVSREVEAASIRINGSVQKPSLRSGFDVRTEWHSWKIKN